MKKIQKGWETGNIRRDGRANSSLAMGDATIKFFVTIAANRNSFAAFAADLINDFCDRENEKLAKLVMSNRAAASVDRNGRTRKVKVHGSKRKAAMCCGWYSSEDDDYRSSNSRIRKSCHRPKKRWNKEEVGVIKHY